jgi:hypothetical protein
MSLFSNPKVLRWEVIRRHGGFLGSNNLVRAIADRFADIGFPLTEEDRRKIDEFIKVFNDSSTGRPEEFSKMTEVEPYRGGIRLMVIHDAVVMETRIESDSLCTTEREVRAEWKRLRKRLKEEEERKIGKLEETNWLECMGFLQVITQNQNDVEKMVLAPGVIEYWMPKSTMGFGWLANENYKRIWLFLSRMLEYIAECNKIRNTWPEDLTQEEVTAVPLEQLRRATEENSRALKELQDKLLNLKEVNVRLKVAIDNLKKIIKLNEASKSPERLISEDVIQQVESLIKLPQSKLEGQIQIDLEQYQNKVDRLKTRGESLNASVQLAEAEAAANLNRIAVDLGFAGVLLAFAQIHIEWFAWDRTWSWLLYSVVAILLYRASVSAGLKERIPAWMNPSCKKSPREP